MKGTDYYTTVGQTIRNLRLKKNMTRKQLADGICSVSYISRIETGGRCPTSVILRQLTTKLGITNEYLFRLIESDSSIHVQKLLKKLFLHIERHDFKNIYNLIDEEQEKLDIKSIHDIQIIRFFKCISQTILNENYQWGMGEIKDILKLTYTEGNNPTCSEFTLMFMYGYFLLLNNQKEEAYVYLTNLKRYSNNIEFFNTHEAIPRFYVYLISACLDTSNFSECLSYLDYSIEYCKEYNTHTTLRELYFLKGELCYRLDNEKKFNIWLNKALTLNELIKKSDDDYFNTFMQNRLKKLKK